MQAKARHHKERFLAEFIPNEERDLAQSESLPVLGVGEIEIIDRVDRNVQTALPVHGWDLLPVRPEIVEGFTNMDANRLLRLSRPQQRQLSPAPSL